MVGIVIKEGRVRDQILQSLNGPNSAGSAQIVYLSVFRTGFVERLQLYFCDSTDFLEFLAEMVRIFDDIIDKRSGSSQSQVIGNRICR